MKRREYLLIMAGTGFGAGWGSLAQAQTTRPIAALESFARRPLMERVALSPDGRSIAAIVNNGSQSMLITRGFDGGEIQPVLSTDNLEFMFNWFRWVNNERLVISLRFPSQREAEYMGIVQTMETRLLAVNADGSQVINLIRQRSHNARALQWAIRQDRVVDWLPEDGKHILLNLPTSERDFNQSVYRVNVYDAERKFYGGTRDDAYDWTCDQEHRLRVAHCRDRQGVRSYWISDPEGKNWRTLSSFGPFAAHAVHPMGFGRDPNLLYVTARHQGLQAVHLVDLRDPNLELKLKLADPRFDLEGGLIHDASGEAVGINVTRAGDSSSFYWDEGYKTWQKSLDEALPDRFNRILSVSRDQKRYIVDSELPGMPGQWYLGEQGEQGRLKLLAPRYPELQSLELGKKQSIQFKARDGLLLRGYLTLPTDHVKGKLLPLVLFPHGGPQASDGPEFDEWAAFMADRGHAVLQINFRGSTGYGREFMEAGLRRWGLEMQDDLTDAVAEAVKIGIADPERVAIVGASYGGYAALMGAIKTPDLFRGAFAFAPITDLLDLTDAEGQFSNREMVRKQIGDAREDSERLKATSPRFHADKVKVPITLIHGTHDRQADHKHSVWMAAALKAAGKPHEFISLDRGDHQLSHYPYRLQLFTALENFLAKVLAPKGARG